MSNYKHGTTVVTSDTNAVKYKALYVGGAGDVAVTTLGDSANVTFKSVPAGTILPIGCVLVLQTGTTATNIVGLN